MEEGAFYETLQLAKSWQSPLILIVENNDWSLATRTQERRCFIDLSKIAEALDIPFLSLSGNKAEEYIAKITNIRNKTIEMATPAIIHVSLTTLGSWYMDTPGLAEGKFINYHHGASPSATSEKLPRLRNDVSDPVHILIDTYGEAEITGYSSEIWAELEALAS